MKGVGGGIRPRAPAPGACTFYGTANSNQMLMEVMGLHLPGAAFVNPGTPLREALTRAAAVRALQITALGDDYRPIGHIVDERAIVNDIVGLLATGGSTNHTIHLVAAARIAGVRIDWNDFDELSAVVPLLARIYPNGAADVNHFHAAGGMAFLVRELLDAGLLHRDVLTVSGDDLSSYAREPMLSAAGELTWQEATAAAADPEAPARVFDSQDALKAAFVAGELDRDVVCAVRFQGPKANGMPELHKLTPSLGVLQDRGFKVALVTDGRMSGASGKVPAAIHLAPEGLAGGAIARIRDGDVVRVDADNKTLDVLLSAQELVQREAAVADIEAHAFGMGRELFGGFRRSVSGAEQGASILSV